MWTLLSSDSEENLQKAKQVRFEINKEMKKRTFCYFLITIIFRMSTASILCTIQKVFEYKAITKSNLFGKKFC